MLKFGAFFLLSITFLLPTVASAYQIEVIPNLPVSGDYVLHQTKTEIKLNPGQIASSTISLINRTGKDLALTFSVEDFSTSTKPNENLKLLGAGVGTYSLKDYLKPEISNITLRHGEQISMSAQISLPESIQPGALYGAVIISAQPAVVGINTNNKVNAVSRLASLFFVRINGQAQEQGKLLDFGTAKNLYFASPVIFEYNYQNSGNVYLNPYGEIKVTDVFGRDVYTKWISPFFVLPDGIRQNQETFNRQSLFGLYRVTLKLNRGYGNIVDEKSQYFAVLSWPYLVVLIALIILGIILVIFIKKTKRRNV